MCSSICTVLLSNTDTVTLLLQLGHALIWHPEAVSKTAVCLLVKHNFCLQLCILCMQSGANGEDKLKVKLKLPAAVEEAACFMPVGGSMSPSQQNMGSWPLQAAAEGNTSLVSLLLPSGSSCTASFTNNVMVLIHTLQLPAEAHNNSGLQP